MLLSTLNTTVTTLREEVQISSVHKSAKCDLEAHGLYCIRNQYATNTSPNDCHFHKYYRTKQICSIV